MDHYNEQLLRKATEGKDTAVRVLIIVGALAVGFPYSPRLYLRSIWDFSLS